MKNKNVKRLKQVDLDNFVFEDCADQSAILYLSVSGNFLNAEIYSGDMVIVDTKRTPDEKDFVYMFAGQYTTFKKFGEVKRMLGGLSFEDFFIIGVVTHCVRKLVL